MFRTVPLSIIRSFSLYAQQWCMSYRFADSQRTGSGRSSILILLSANLYDVHHRYCCVYSEKKTPGDGQRNCPKHVEFYSINKIEKLKHLVGLVIRIYHDARSLEGQKLTVVQSEGGTNIVSTADGLINTQCVKATLQALTAVKILRYVTLCLKVSCYRRFERPCRFYFRGSRNQRRISYLFDPRIMKALCRLENVRQRGPRQLSRYSDSLRAGRSGDRNPVWVKFSLPVLGLTQAPVQWVAGLSLGTETGGVALTSHLIQRRG